MNVQTAPRSLGWLSAGRFLKERYPIAISLPLAVAFAAVGFEGRSPSSAGLITCAVWLALFSARAHDDLQDLVEDRQRKPDRALSRGLVSAYHLERWAWLGFLSSVFLFALQSLLAALLLVGGAVQLFWYYRSRESLPKLLRPAILNLAFFWVSLAAGTSTSPNLSVLLLAGFAWSAIVAHDYSHSITADGQSELGLETKRQITCGALWFGLSLSLGLGFAVLAEDLTFAAVLATQTVAVALHLGALIGKRRWRSARSIYVWGCLFYACPLLSRSRELALELTLL